MREHQKVGLRRMLRKCSTPAESMLWSRLRSKRLNGRKFRRQHPIGPYVVDFCCVGLRLVIELDGDVHAFRTAEDDARDRWLEDAGYKVLRFANTEVLESLAGVMEILWSITRCEEESPSP